MSDDVVAAFVAAWRSGDPERMSARLDPDAVLLVDTGGVVDGPREPVNGAGAITAWMLTRFAPDIHRLSLTTANTRPAVLVARDGVLVGTVVLRSDEQRVTMLWATLNPEKLRASR